MNDTTRIAVLMGGNSAEREVSIRSGTAVHRALLNLGLEADAVDLTPENMAEVDFGRYRRCFIALHGRGGEDGCIQGFLEMMGIPYTGSGVQASAIGMDKGFTKDVWRARGLPTPEYLLVNQSDAFDEENARQLIGRMGTVMIKPVHEGSSIGMAKVDNASDLLAAIEAAFRYDAQVLLEQYIQGEEYTVAVVRGQALPPIRLKTPNSFYDYEAKYQLGTTEYLCPCGLESDSEIALKQLGVQAFAAIGCKGWGRVDVMRDQQGQFWLLEVNTVPGMTEKSLVPMAAKAAGLSFEQLVSRILESADQ